MIVNFLFSNDINDFSNKLVSKFNIGGTMGDIVHVGMYGLTVWLMSNIFIKCQRKLEGLEHEEDKEEKSKEDNIENTKNINDNNKGKK